MMSLDYPFEFDECQYRVAEKKLSLAELPFSIREFHDLRARGGSKTFDTMIVALYLASLGFEGIWFAAHSRQMEQPKKYLQKIINRSYLKYLTSDLLKESVKFESGGELQILNLTEDNARSPRADFVIYDELARAERDAYNASEFITSVTQLGLIINISTPCKATIEEERYEIIKRREIMNNETLVSELCWYDISFLARKKEWYDELKKLQPPWFFRQENECSHELPMGAVFQNVIYDPYPDWLMSTIKDMPQCSGVDWNPAAGHTRVTIKWTPSYDAAVVVGSTTFSVGYAREMREKEFYDLAPWFTNGNRLVLETGGINIPYIDWFEDMIERFRFNWRKQCWYTEEWDSSGLHKMQTINYLLQHGVTIYVDKMRFPEVAKQIEECSWDEDATGDPKIKKESANSPHFLDAFLHSLSEKCRDEISYEVSNW